jgi:hypothetical protein
MNKRFGLKTLAVIGALGLGAESCATISTYKEAEELLKMARQECQFALEMTREYGSGDISSLAQKRCERLSDLALEKTESIAKPEGESDDEVDIEVHDNIKPDSEETVSDELPENDDAAIGQDEFNFGQCMLDGNAIYAPSSKDRSKWLTMMFGICGDREKEAKQNQEEFDFAECISKGNAMYTPSSEDKREWLDMMFGICGDREKKFNERTSK